MINDFKFTIMTVPLPFSGFDAITQRNAILSWTLLKPRPEILVLCNEQGVAEFAEEHNLVHIPDVRLTKHGVPSIAHILELGQANASNGVIAYVDSDTVLTHDFPIAVYVVESTFPGYLISGFRKSDYMTHTIPFEDPKWEQDLIDHVWKHGNFYAKGLGSGSDYFVFHKGLFRNDVPDFSIGKGHWDGWRMRYAIDHGAELLDCSDIIFQIHQDHPWRSWFCNATHDNLALAGGEVSMRWVHDATQKLTKEWLAERLSIVSENKLLGTRNKNPD